MPSSVGRSKMPHNNRVSGSAALRTNDMWSKTIGYDPYAAENEKQEEFSSAEQSAGLLLLAKMSNLSGSESRGACKKCGMVGHLTFQCRNQSTKTEEKDSSDSESSSEKSEGEDIRLKSELYEAQQKANKDRLQNRSKKRELESPKHDKSKREKKRKHHSKEKKKEKSKRKRT